MSSAKIAKLNPPQFFVHTVMPSMWIYANFTIKRIEQWTLSKYDLATRYIYITYSYLPICHPTVVQVK